MLENVIATILDRSKTDLTVTSREWRLGLGYLFQNGQTVHVSDFFQFTHMIIDSWLNIPLYPHEYPIAIVINRQVFSQFVSHSYLIVHYPDRW